MMNDNVAMLVAGATLGVCVLLLSQKKVNNVNATKKQDNPYVANGEDPSVAQAIVKSLKERETNGSLRGLTMESENIQVESLIDFASNDYFGFARDESLWKIIEAKTKEFHSINKLGSTGSRLLSGDSKLARDFEAYLTTFHDGACSVLFNSGFDANLSVFSSVPQSNTIVIYDELVHNSIREGLRLCRAKKSISFKHNDVKDLHLALRENAGCKSLIIALESVYSMDGDVAPLQEICALAKQYGAEIIIDEAHGVGCFGEGGRGWVQQLGLQREFFLRVYTFGKALGCHGAVVVCRDDFMKPYFLNYARPLIYSTATSPHSIISARCAYEYMNQHASEKQALMKKRLALFHSLMQDLRHLLIPSPSPIQAILIPGGNSAVNACAKYLREHQFFMFPIRSPTVPRGTERLRIIIHAFNSEEEIKRLVDAVREFLRASEAHS